MLLRFIVITVFIYLLVLVLRSTKHRKQTKKKNTVEPASDKTYMSIPYNYDDEMYDDEIKTTKNTVFYKKKLMNKEEYNVFKKIELMLTEHDTAKYRLMAQVSLGEILGNKDDDKYFNINSKRVDMLIINVYGDPLCVIEHQGSGHNQGNSEERDAIKRTSIEEAGILYLETKEHMTEIEMKLFISKIKTCLYEDERNVAVKYSSKKTYNLA